MKSTLEPYCNEQYAKPSVSTRDYHPDDTIIEVGGDSCDKVVIGGDEFVLIGGPCVVESKEHVLEVAKAVKARGAKILRGGAFKARTSPYSFQGLGARGIEYLKQAREETGLPIICEITEASQLSLYEDIDIIQIGARNSQNFELLKAVGRFGKPVMLKRGMCSTYADLLMCAEYVMNEGNDRIILCERGIRTFENYARNTLDITAVPSLKQISHLPVIVDPSHATGRSELVIPVSLAAVSAGADGLMVEVHDNPADALCDGPQSLTYAQFSELSHATSALHRFLGEL